MINDRKQFFVKRAGGLVKAPTGKKTQKSLAMSSRV
jgi:hypothetical protein